MKDTYYTIGKIVRDEMMISRTGKPYRSKAAIIRIIRSHKLTHERIATPHGLSYSIPLSTILWHNAEMRAKRRAKMKA